MLAQIPRLMLAEAQAVRQTTATFVCSETDRRYLARLAGSERLEIVPNSVAVPPPIADDASEALVLFVGSMVSRHDAQAVEYLVREIWPAHCKAVVSTRLGAEGLEFADGREIVLRETAGALAEACVRLLRDAGAAAALGKAARARAERVYDRRAVLERLVRLFGNAIGTRSRQ